MITPTPHPREQERLESVRLQLDVTPTHDPVLVALAEVAARELTTPIAAVNLLDHDLQVTRAGVGFDGAHQSRDISLCTWVVAQDDLLEVPDLLQDPRFRDSPVAQAGLRFYAGAPVRDPAGLPIGSLCVLDAQARVLTAADRTQLEELAESVSAQFALLRARAGMPAAGTVDLAATEAGRADLHDPLTGLPQRELLLDRLGQALTETARETSSVGVAVLGLDGFRRVNHGRGHATGDRLLRAVAERVQEQVRAGDTLARLHGDQFVLLWRDLDDAADVDALSERLASAFVPPFDLDGTSLSVTASMGVAVGRSPQDAEDLLREADAAMHEAKLGGGGRLRVSTPEARDAQVHRLRTEVELRRAIEQDELVLHYQPVLDLTLGEVVGVEALVRWQHPTDGLILPDDFISVAEASGLIVPLGAWVLDEACRQAKAWDDLGRQLDMAVNLSVRQVSHPDLVPSLRRALATSGLPAERLMVEMTESAVMEDAERADVALRAIDELGASIAIDDFGTGYSSLLYLKRYPIRALKVDRSFVAGLGTNRDDAAIVASLIGLSRAVGGVCIAEGVEDQTQYERLVALGCQFAQGYLFSRPVPADELLAAVEECEQRLAAAGRRVPRSGRHPVARVPNAVAARLRELHAEGASLHTIAAALNVEGLPHPEGIRWHATYVRRQLAVEARGIRPA